MIAVVAGRGWGKRREMVGYCSARDRAWRGGVMDCRSRYRVVYPVWVTGSGRGGVSVVGRMVL